MKMFKLLSLIIIPVLLFTCNNDDGDLSPFEPEIFNQPDNFSFQATGVESISAVREYVWSNSGSLANIDHSSSVSKGSTLLKVYDAAGIEVYSSNLIPSGNFTSNSGTNGDWKIRIEMTGVDGTLNFRVEKGI